MGYLWYLFCHQSYWRSFGRSLLKFISNCMQENNLKYNILFHYIVSASVESYKHKWKLGRMGNAVETWVTDNNNCFHSFSTSHKFSWDSVSRTWQKQQENVFYFFRKPDMNVHTKCMLRLKVFTPKWKHRFGAVAVEGH